MLLVEYRDTFERLKLPNPIESWQTKTGAAFGPSKTRFVYFVVVTTATQLGHFQLVSGDC